ncbi:hypothetical protein OS493_011604 [Desmophyllum pertusum]|uniref:Uncharacterized protein n=1 Tax=Desmophyllum pertusum TaxID=174260 RepID=A0A9W9YQP8_9CNID|nr:hypothetical protein OS493_011604 [Desmophyllum pertusum]
MMAARLQQSGFLRQQFGNAPFLPPGVFNPLVQQQLMALGLPFGLPFHTGGHQAWPGVGPRGPVRHPVQGHRPPVGRSGTGPVGRGRPFAPSFAPRFHHPGVVNIRTHDDLEKSSTGNSSTSSLERTSSAMNAPEMQKEAVEDNRSTANDAQKGNVRSSWTPASPENTNMKGNVRPSGTPASPENINMESASRASADVKSISDSSCVKHNMMPSPSTGSDVSPKNIFNTMPNESREETGCQGTSPSSQEAGKMGRIGGEGHLLASSPSSTVSKQEDYLESPGTKKTPPCKITQSELFLKEQKSELKRIKSENETLRQSVDWRRSGGMADNSSYPREKWEALKCQIHLKEVHLQKEKEMILARKAEQEILYEREKLECSWDQQLKKELETEKRIGETENKIHLAKLENELLRLYQNLHGSKELKDSSITTDEKL